MENGERREETIVGRSGRPQHPAVHDADDSSGWRKSSHRHETHKEEPINRECCAVTQGVSWNDIYYIAAFGIFGAVLRVYIGRIFGGDCETETNEIGDFWEASDICITANGLTDRRGGALFIDLPGNFVGSFLMGLLSASTAQPIPWFPKDHHLQRHTSWHKGLTTGFCGCLTTFASWNTQMVVMLDGTQTESGSQILSALFGYAIGLLTAVAAFLWGRFVATRWHNGSRMTELHARTFDEEDDDIDEEQPSEDRHRGPSDVFTDKKMAAAIQQMTMPLEERDTSHRGDYEEPITTTVPGGRTQDPSIEVESLADETAGPLMHLNGSVLWFSSLSVVVALFLLFGYGDVFGNYKFYRRMWLSCLLTPVGAVLRNQFNHWLPVSNSVQWGWGTLGANVLGSVVSILLEVFMIRFLAEDELDSWLGTSIWALKVGFAGSLSTVSTFVKELVSLERLLDRHVYGIVTLVISMGLGLAIYSPLVRS